MIPPAWRLLMRPPPTKMVRLCDRCPRGERLIGRVPQGHWKTMTFVAALRRNGMRAPCTVDGAMNGTKFLAYVKQCLAPTLKRKDIVVIDNLPAHKAAGVREASKRAVRCFAICPNIRRT